MAAKQGKGGEFPLPGEGQQVITKQSGGTTVSEYAGLSVERKAELAGIQTAARVRAEVEGSYIIAMRRPRNEADVRARILERCKDKEFAQAATYSKPVAGKQMRGFSIRFAEEIMRLWGNLQVSIDTIYEDDDRRTKQITVKDYEANFAIRQEITLNKTVERHKTEGRRVLGQRLNSGGETVFIVEATEDELITKEAAAISKAMRQISLRMIPGDLKAECERAITTAVHTADRRDPKEEQKKVCDAFQSINIMPKDLEAFLGQKISTISSKQLQALRDIFTGIKEGHTTWKQVMEAGASAKAGGPKGQGATAGIVSDLFAGDVNEHQAPQAGVS